MEVLTRQEQQSALCSLPGKPMNLNKLPKLEAIYTPLEDASLTYYNSVKGRPYACRFQGSYFSRKENLTRTGWFVFWGKPIPKGKKPHQTDLFEKGV